MKYLIVIERTETGYSAYLPDLPGCVATGLTTKDVEENIREAISFHLEGMAEDGESPNPPQSFAVYQEVGS
ncbi:MAG: type II toxin-antitoxin system HicB family antitoxin [Deltaproteobacteria bacterium]|nr:type II toxin-antitoxin system HicB family antitoxin [Deltaproteobacteria bacterium]